MRRLPAQERHTISIQAYGTSSQFTTTPLIPQAAEFYSGAQTTQYNVLQATDTIHSNDKLTLVGSAGLSTATGNSGISELASVGATWQPDDARHLQRIVCARRRRRDAGHGSKFSAIRRRCASIARVRSRTATRPANSRRTARRTRCASATRISCAAATFRSRSTARCKTASCCRSTSTASCSTSSASCRPGYLQEVAQIYNSPAGCNTPAETPFIAAAALHDDAGRRRAARSIKAPS